MRRHQALNVVFIIRCNENITTGQLSHLDSITVLLQCPNPTQHIMVDCTLRLHSTHRSLDRSLCRGLSLTRAWSGEWWTELHALHPIWHCRCRRSRCGAGAAPACCQHVSNKKKNSQSQTRDVSVCSFVESHTASVVSRTARASFTPSRETKALFSRKYSHYEYRYYSLAQFWCNLWDVQHRRGNLELRIGDVEVNGLVHCVRQSHLDDDILTAKHAKTTKQTQILEKCEL